MRVLGLDPGLQRTGWGMIEVLGVRLCGIACGTVTSNGKANLADRLAQLYDGIEKVIETYRPDCAAVEETFVSVNAASTLKLGQARAISLLAPARAGLPVSEYAAKSVKKSVVGAGAADKKQVKFAINKLLPALVLPGTDAADALAVAICHAHHAQTACRIGGIGFAAQPGNR